MRYGYVRVSAKDQNLERQFVALRDADVCMENIFADKISGKDFQRPQYRRLLNHLKEEDVFVVKSIDRLGRDYSEILEQWRIITKEKGAYMEVLDMPLLNTNIGHGDLTGKIIADIVLELLAYVAETERSFIKSRQAEGIATAKARGVRFGRPAKEVPENFDMLIMGWKQKKLPMAEVVRVCGVSEATIYRWLRERNGKKEK